MERTISFGKLPVYSNRKVNEVTFNLSLTDEEGGKPVFTCCGDVWNAQHTDCIMGGQCIDDEEIKNAILTHCTTEEINRYLIIVNMWRKYHLNDMHPGTPAQERALAAYRLKNPGYHSYDDEVAYLESVNLNHDHDYTYGTGWLYEPIPPEDLAIIKWLMDGTI